MSEKWTTAQFREYMQGKPPPGNRKVKNAQKTEQNGVVFDSRLERYMHDLLEMHKIPFQFQKRYVLQEGFKYGGEVVRAITYTIDFELPQFDLIIDTKGYQTQQGRMRIKMLKRVLAASGRKTRIELPSTRDECAALVRKLLENGKI